MNNNRMQEISKKKQTFLSGLEAKSTCGLAKNCIENSQEGRKTNVILPFNTEKSH